MLLWLIDKYEVVCLHIWIHCYVWKTFAMYALDYYYASFIYRMVCDFYKIRLVEELVAIYGLDNYFNFRNKWFNIALIFSSKIILSVLFLILIRAGLPRYRYDYITKLGWAKFLFTSVCSFIYFFFVYAIL